MQTKPNHHNSGTWEDKHFLENTNMKEMSIITLEAGNPTLIQEYLTLTHTSSCWGNHFRSFCDFSLPYLYVIVLHSHMDGLFPSYVKVRIQNKEPLSFCYVEWLRVQNLDF